MESNRTLTIKMRKGKNSQEYRRATIDTPTTFTAFMSKFVEAFGPLEADSRLKFEDEEGDSIILANQSDYEEALRVVSKSQHGILRISVHGPRPEREGGRCPRNAQSSPCGGSQSEPSHCPAGGFGGFAANPLGPFADLLRNAQSSLPDLLNNPAVRSMAEGLMSSHALKIVQPYVCDNCNASIAGDRFHSTTNPNFDLCNACHASPVGQLLEEGHKFEKITALESLVQTLRNGGTFDASFAPGPAQSEPVLRHRAMCDVCQESIVGIRHKCLDCADYDECNVCFLREKQPHALGHLFHAINDPSIHSIPTSVMEAHTARKAQEAKRVAEEAQKVAEEQKRIAEEQQKAASAAAAAAAAEEEASRQRQQSEKEPTAFERNLITLESMGFTDRKRNIQVLVRNRNKLFESIQELLNSGN